MPDARQPCTCQPSPPKQHVACPVCHAWERGTVLLVSGLVLTKTQWLLAQESPRRAPGQDGGP